MDERGELKRNFDRPIIKDSISVPLQGYAIIRFIADNPGFWMAHCHLDSHSDTGMMMILKVGETRDLPSMPKDLPFYFYQTYSASSNRNTPKLYLFFLLFLCIKNIF